MIFQKLILSALLLLSTRTIFGLPVGTPRGSSSGGGGDALVCDETPYLSTFPKVVYLADTFGLFYSKDRNFLHYSMNIVSKEVAEQILLGQIQSKSAEEAQKIRSILSRLKFSYVNYRLPELEDDDIRTNKRAYRKLNCEKQQLAIQDRQSFEVTVNKELYSSLSDFEKAALRIHEAYINYYGPSNDTSHIRDIVRRTSLGLRNKDDQTWSGGDTTVRILMAASKKEGMRGFYLRAMSHARSYAATFGDTIPSSNVDINRWMKSFSSIEYSRGLFWDVGISLRDSLNNGQGRKIVLYPLYGAFLKALALSGLCQEAHTKNLLKALSVNTLYETFVGSRQWRKFTYIVYGAYNRRDIGICNAQRPCATLADVIAQTGEDFCGVSQKAPVLF